MINIRAFFHLIIFYLLAVCVGVDVHAQEHELSWTAKHLKVRVENGDYNAVLETAATGDITLIPYLKQLAANLEGRGNFNHPSLFAHVALARFDDAEAIQQILAEVDNKSPAIQDRGMAKLSLVGGKAAYKKFYELLDDTRPRENTDCLKMFEEHNKKYPADKLSPYCDVVYFPKSLTAVLHLRKMIENPLIKTSNGTKGEIDRWRRFLKKSKLID